MTISASSSPLYKKMSWRRGKSPGWAAFDLKQQQKQGLVPEAEKEPYPPITSIFDPLCPYQNSLKSSDISVKPFSSVLLPSVDFPTLTANEDFEQPLQIGNSSGSNKPIVDHNEENSVVQAYERLKELYSWVEESLIEDIMVAVNNDFDKASTLLKEMISSEISEDKETQIVEFKYDSEDILVGHNTSETNKDISTGEVIDFAELSYALDNCLNYKNEDASSGKMLQADGGYMELILGNLKFVPVEPESEEDDIYSIHRKDAIRMMRSASRHSKLANDAYLRGDHLLAHQFSQKAREEWKAAERLNAKAAKEILRIRNCKNDMWKLDLHGLHSAEAVQALREQLQKIESQVSISRYTSPDRVNAKAGIKHSTSLESLSCMDIEKWEKQWVSSSRQRPTTLEVITGKGNHSRGEAALPAAIRDFLSEKGYRYDEVRLGVIMVRPMFRRQQTLVSPPFAEME